MKIAWFTEGGWSSKIPRNFKGMRNDSAWMCTLGADHYNIHQGQINNEYDLAIITIPKKNPQFFEDVLVFFLDGAGLELHFGILI